MLSRWISTICLLLVGSILLAAEVAAPVRYKFYYELPKAEKVTSAGVYDAKDHLVKTLWSMEPRAAGVQIASWDGLDQDSQPMPDGVYNCKVVLNNSKYWQKGVIGNSANPSNTFNHVPINFEAVAVDNEDFIYTVHDWDEPHNDVIRWNPTTGAVASHSGHPIGELLKAVAVDENFAYVSFYADLNNREKARFSIARLRINKKPGTVGWPVEAFTKAGNIIKVYDGNAQFPDGTNDADKGTMYVPLLSLAVSGNILYATDSLAGKVHKYDKVSGDEIGAIAVPLPQTVAIAPDGRIWVGHSHTKISVFGTDGKLLATPIDDLKEVNAIAFNPDGKLYVADQGAGQVKIFTIAGTNARMTGTLGKKAVPGDRAEDRFFNLHGLAVDSKGNVITAQNEFFFNGGRLAKFDSAGKVQWEQYGLEFQSIGTYGNNNPEQFISVMFHSYKLDYETAKVEYLGNGYTGTGYHGSPSGPPRICRIGAKDFYYFPSNDSVQIYRIDPNPAGGAPLLKFVSILGRAQPLPNGTDAAEIWRGENYYLWSWHDVRGDNTIHQEDISMWSKPGDNKPLWQYGPMTVDADKNIWLSSADRGGITPERNSTWMIPFAGIDALGNPIYEWKNVVNVIPTGALKWDPDMKMVQHDADGYTYVSAITKREGTPQSGGVWMSGNTLACFDGAERRWQIILPNIAVGMDIIPGNQGGVMIGGDPFKGGIHHYTRDGLLVGTWLPNLKIMGEPPNNPHGLLDFFGCIVVKRNPHDGILDVFVEDDFNLRIAWYRVDDRFIDTISGKMEPAN